MPQAVHRAAPRARSKFAVNIAGSGSLDQKYAAARRSFMTPRRPSRMAASRPLQGPQAQRCCPADEVVRCEPVNACAIRPPIPRLRRPTTPQASLVTASPTRSPRGLGRVRGSPARAGGAGQADRGPDRGGPPARVGVRGRSGRPARRCRRGVGGLGGPACTPEELARKNSEHCWFSRRVVFASLPPLAEFDARPPATPRGADGRARQGHDPQGRAHARLGRPRLL